MANRPQNSPKGLFAKSKVYVGAQALTANSTTMTLAGKLAVSGKTLTIESNSTTTTFSGRVAVSGKTPTISSNSTTITLSGKLAVSGKTPTLEANSTTMTMSGKLALSGKTPTLEANTTAIIASALRIGALASYLTADSTGVKLGTRYLSTNTTGNSTT